MARAGINKRGLRRELSVQLGPGMRRKIIQRTRQDIQKVVTRMLAQFNSHPVTREIEGGPSAQNLSGTLGGRGNLFSFIGFDRGDVPIAPVRKLLQNSTKLVSVRQLKNKLDFEIIIELPSKDEIARESPVPWAAARSWVLGIEQGLAGLGQFLVKPGVGRSGGGIQVSGQLKGGSFKNQKYISTILKELQLNLMRALRS